MSERTLDDALDCADEWRQCQAVWLAHFRTIPAYEDVVPHLVLLADEVARLRQGLWECGGIAGDDQDGDKTPLHMTFPDIVVYAKRAVQEMAEGYDKCLDEIKLDTKLATENARLCAENERHKANSDRYQELWQAEHDEVARLQQLLKG